MNKLLLLILMFSVFTQACLAKPKKPRLFKATIIHYDHSKSKGVLYQIAEGGVILVNTRDVLRHPLKELIVQTNSGRITTRQIPYDQVKTIVIRRRNSVWRGVGFGAIVGAAIGTIMVVQHEISHDKNEQCGCGPPMALIVPPLAVICAVTGAFIGMFPVKTGAPDPEHPYESTEQKFNKYALVNQLSDSNQ